MPSKRIQREKKARQFGGNPATNNNALAAAKEQKHAIMVVSNVPVQSEPPATLTDPSSIDLLGLGPIERKALAFGTSVKIYLDGEMIMRMPRLLFTATSSKPSALLNSDDEVHLPSYLNKSSVLSILEWITEATKVNVFRSFRFKGALAEAIQVNQAAEALGMTKYTARMYYSFRRDFFKIIPSCEELASAEILCHSRNDGFMDIIAGRIAYLIRNGQLSYDEDYMINIASECPKVMAAVRRFNKKWQSYMDGAAARPRREENQAKIAAHKEAKLQRIQKEKETREALIEKLGGSKVRCFSTEDMELADRLCRTGDVVVMKLWR